MRFLDEFPEIVKLEEPLAPYTYLRLGGPAAALVQPRSLEELSTFLKRAQEERVSYRILGGGCNLLVPEEGVAGVVLRLSEPAFCGLEVKGNILHAGAGASLSGLISQAARSSLAGLECLIGIPGTVGGALRGNAGSRSGTVSQYVQRVHVFDPRAEIQVRERDELSFAPEDNSLDHSLILAAEFALEPDQPDLILKRMRKFWIHRKAHQPLSFEASARLFRDPKGASADVLIEQAGLQGTRVGGAELSQRHPNYVIAHAGATPRDVLRLIDLVRTRIADQLGQQLQLDLVIW